MAGPAQTRGYIKLSGACKTFKFDFRDKTVLDIGSSTGGFTMYALEQGAKKVIAIDTKCNSYVLKERLYELENILPTYFIRINKSTLANEHRIARFDAVFSGGVDAVFQCGYREYVSRRCFAEIRRRYEGI